MKRKTGTIDLRLGHVELPISAVTETFAVLGKRGSGKTTTARVLTERLLDADLPVIVLDPTGVWWGLRSTADGQSEGYPVVIFGGDHADVPLEEHASGLIADVIVDERIPAVLDLSHLSKTKMRSFVALFLERLYHRNREPLMVVIDEADLFAPQRAVSGSERLLGAMDDLVRRGRARGLGTTLITQRPQVLNKDVLSQAEVLLCLRMIGTRDIGAIDDWVRVHAEEDEAKTVKASLPSLPVGTAWLWSPGWLGVLERVEIPAPRTFDSSATPKAGEARARVKRMAAVDLARLGEQIQQRIEQQRATDPRVLQKRVRELEAELARARAERPEPVEIPVPVISDDVLDQMRRAFESAQKMADEYAQRVSDAFATVAELMAPLRDLPGPTPAPQQARPQNWRENLQPPRQRERARPAATDVPQLPRAQRKILAALAMHGPRSQEQVGVLTGYSHNGGGFNNALGALRSAGYVEGGRDLLTVTRAGELALGPYEEMPVGRALREWWKQHQAVPKAAGAILDVLAEQYPAEVPIEEIAERTGYAVNGGGFNNAVSRLRSLRLASGRRALRISDELM